MSFVSNWGCKDLTGTIGKPSLPLSLLQVFAKVAKDLLSKSEGSAVNALGDSKSAGRLFQKRSYNPFRSEDIPHDPHQQVSATAALERDSAASVAVRAVWGRSS